MLLLFVTLLMLLRATVALKINMIVLNEFLSLIFLDFIIFFYENLKLTL